MKRKLQFVNSQFRFEITSDADAAQSRQTELINNMKAGRGRKVNENFPKFFIRLVLSKKKMSCHCFSLVFAGMWGWDNGSNLHIFFAFLDLKH